eukprot:TRINITY_DN30409_c0_g1_i1.p1 TRINITY_DN30409_c0_g1~~TRINITY_DN30409_c0_g1_i1.p1  ORF type:complete len:702 (-),score=85.08 TRINITY_DN30409_c0_g1_i1:570-2675(-)
MAPSSPAEDYVSSLRSAVIAFRTALVVNLPQTEVPSDDLRRKACIMLSETIPAPRVFLRRGRHRSLSPGRRPTQDSTLVRKRALSCDRQSREHRNDLNGLCPSTTFFLQSSAMSFWCLLGQRVAAFRDGTTTPGMNTVAWRRAFASVENGQLTTDLAHLTDKILGNGRTLVEAIAEIRESIESSALRVYGAFPDALRTDISSDHSSFDSVATALTGLNSHVSPVCSRLTWSLLRGILLSFLRSALRSSLDLILETCYCAFKLDCDVIDILLAIACGPAGACDIEVAPWAVRESAGATEKCELTSQSKRMFESTVLVLCPEADKDSGITSTCFNSVFPPYSPLHASAIEMAYFGKDSAKITSTIQGWLFDAQLASTMSAEAISVPLLFTIVAAMAPMSSWQPTVGALLWVWEKASFHASQMTSNAINTNLVPSDDAENSDLPIALQNSATDTLLPSREMDSLEPNPAESRPTLEPEEALVLCFHRDILQRSNLFLGQLNNLFRLRSGGLELDYERAGHARFRDFLSSIAGVEVNRSGRLMMMQLSDEAVFTELVDRVNRSVNERIARCKEAGIDTSGLEVKFRIPRDLPKKILDRIWKLFWSAENFEIKSNAFLSIYNTSYPSDKLRFKALGHQDVRGLLAQVPFLEKVGSRQAAYYTLSGEALPIGAACGCSMNVARRSLEARRLECVDVDEDPNAPSSVA